jgi:hypothetical protein
VIEVNYANPALITQLFGGAVIYDNAGFLQLGAQGLGLGVTANGQPGLSQGGYNQAPTGQPGYNQAALGQRTYQPGLSPLAPGLGNGPPIGVPATPPGP